MAGVDREKLLERVAGKLSLLRGMAEAFERALPELTSAIGAAISRRDAASLRRAAHALKGSVSNFEYAPAVEAAQELELMGRDGRFEGAEARYGELQRELKNLLGALAEVLREPAS